ncbi:hypothetical protein chiPu_0030948 [Chiloscyllium punctatum]|uniref:Uncharacterized protein n=1 Tax=Chiloscyllium punctatum TaxID=137246 RepID=A0A401TVV4_CHIPU|nr:hypothetical protein [Chiloscyllium punctatum]
MDPGPRALFPPLLPLLLLSAISCSAGKDQGSSGILQGIIRIGNSSGILRDRGSIQDQKSFRILWYQGGAVWR